jgi:hypothetical protein
VNKHNEHFVASQSAAGTEGGDASKWTLAQLAAHMTEQVSGRRQRAAQSLARLPGVHHG